MSTYPIPLLVFGGVNMRGNKFNIGHRVHINSTEHKGTDFIVTAVIEEDVHNMFKDPGVVSFGTDFKYRYQLKTINETGERFVYASEESIEEIPMTERELQAIRFAESVADANGYTEADPTFKVGDVVKIKGTNTHRRFVVKELAECVGTNHMHAYNLIPIDNEDQLMMFTEDALTLEYHDVGYEFQLGKY